MARLPRTLARVAGLLAALALLCAAALHHPSVRARVLDRARSYAERELHVALRASSLNYSLFARTIELRDVSVASTSGAEPFLQADRVEVTLGRGVLLGRPAVTGVTVGAPRITLVRDRNGAMNLPPSGTSTGPSSPLSLGVVSVTALSVRVDDRLAQRSFTVGPLDLSIDTAAASRPGGAFGPSRFTVRAGQTDVSGTLAGRLGFDGTRVRVDEFTAITSEGRAAVAGWLDVTGERPAISLHTKATIDVARAARLASLDARPLAGTVEGTVDVTGALAAPEITLTLLTHDARYAPLGPVRLSGRSSFKGSRALVQALDIDSAAGALHAEGAIDLDDAASPAARASRVALRWSNVRIDNLIEAAGSSMPIPSGSLAAGSATIDFDVRDVQARAWSRLRAAATTTLEPVPPTAARQDALSLSGRADLALDAGRWSLRHSIESSTAKAVLAGTLTGLLSDQPQLRSTLAGRSRLRVADVGTLPPLLQSAGVTMPADVVDGLTGSLIATLDFAGTTERPRAGIDLDARDVKARVLPQPATLAARLDVDADGIRAHSVDARSGTTALRAEGRYSWRGPYEGRGEITSADLSEVATQFRLPVPVTGSARIEATITGARQSGNAVLSLAARDLVVDQVSIGPLTANSRAALAPSGLVTLDAAAPRIGARAQLEIVNRAGYPVSGDITIDHDQVGALIPPSYQRQVGDVSGALSATAKVSGQLSDPAGIRGRVDLHALDLTAHGTRVVLAAPASITVAEDRVAADAVDLRIGQRSRATIEGQLGVTALSRPLRVRLEGPLVELIDIGSRTAGVAPVAVRSDGTAAFDVTVGGTFNLPQPHGSFTLRGASLAYGSLAPLTNLRLDAAIDPTVITVSTFASQWQDATLAGSAFLPWRVLVGSLQSPALAPWLNALPLDPARATLNLRAENVTQAVLEDALPAERLAAIQGNVAATLAADADRLSLDRIRATAVIDRASLVLAGVPVNQSVPTQVRLDNGRATIDAFRWNAGAESIAVTGGANLMTDTPTIDAGVSGVVDLRVLGAFVPDISSAGSATADLTVTGPFDNPEIVGRIDVKDGELQVETPRLAASNLSGALRISGNRQVTVALAGLLNTGRVRLEGTVDLRDFAAPGANLQLTGRRVAMEFPSGLQTESNADLRLAVSGAASTLTGRVDVLGGTYREPLVLSSRLLNFSSASGIAAAAPSNDWLSRLRLDLTVATADDVRIDNNYGRLDVGASLRLVGTPASPGVLGRIQGGDDGEIYLGGNTYRIERLLIDLTNPRGITPDVDFAAQTRVGDVPIGVALRCPATGPCERKVTSLSTNVDDKEAEARLLGSTSAASAGQGLARLLSGELLGVVGRTVGLDAVRLEQGGARRDIFDDPTLIAGDVDPAARLTLGKRLGSGVDLVYSQNLADEGFSWITSYTGPRGLSARVLILDDNSRSYEFRHEPIGAGRTASRPRPPGPRVAAVSITGTPGFSEAEVRRQLRLTEGDRFTFGAWQADRDRLARFYHTRAFLEARISARRLPADRDGRVGLEYTIARGPATRTVVRGATLPDAVRERVAQRWRSALFDGFLEKDATAIVREHLYREGHLNATVAASVVLDPATDVKTLTIDIVPGPSLPSRLTVTGNAVLSEDQLLQVVATSEPLAAWRDPHLVERLLEDAYRAEGLLAARVSVGSPRVVDGTSVVVIAVSEGTPYSLGDVAVTGLPDQQRQDAREALALSSGDRYRPALVADGLARLETRLRQRAYRQARVDADTAVDPGAARVDVAARVTLGPQSIVRDIVVEGDAATKPMVARSIAFTLGAPLDPASVDETRRRLYGLDVYRSVDIDVQPIEPSPASTAGAAPGEEPVTARIALAQRPRYRLRYGIAVSDEEVTPGQRDQRLGFAADVENRNLFGRGATAGASLRLRSDQQVGRLSLGAKRFFALPIRSTVFVEREREQLNPDGAFPITTDISSLTLEQAYRVTPSIDLRYGYSTENNHTFVRSEQADPFDLTVNIARFISGGVVDRRNDPFNPSRGWFTASTLELSTPGIGSDLKFLKNFAQYSHFVPVGTKLVVASAARLGLARTFDGEVLIPSERFFAGGASTVRGYREGTLGAESVLGDPEGGSALLVLNGELRFPVYRWLKGVGFVDAGNVFPHVRDISLSSLQVGFGAGARVDTPFGLVRFDLGVPANPRSIDPRWRLHIGFGHAF